MARFFSLFVFCNTCKCFLTSFTSSFGLLNVKVQGTSRLPFGRSAVYQWLHAIAPPSQRSEYTRDCSWYIINFVMWLLALISHICLRCVGDCFCWFIQLTRLCSPMPFYIYVDVCFRFISWSNLFISSPHLWYQCGNTFNGRCSTVKTDGSLVSPRWYINSSRGCTNTQYFVKSVDNVLLSSALDMEYNLNSFNVLNTVFGMFSSIQAG